MGLKEDINNNQITLVVISKTDYLAKINSIISAVGESSKKICYVALNKPYNSILANLKKIGLDTQKFYFIDVLTASVQTPPTVDNCTFIQSPSAITDLSLSFSMAMADKECDIAVFDTISTLIIYESAGSVIKLSQNLMTKMRVTDKKAVFITLKEDSETLIKDLTMFVDIISVV